MTGDISNQVFHEFWIVVGSLCNVLLIGSLQDAVQLTTRFFFDDLNYFLDPDEGAAINGGRYVRTLIMGSIF